MERTPESPQPAPTAFTHGVAPIFKPRSACPSQPITGTEDRFASTGQSYARATVAMALARRPSSTVSELPRYVDLHRHHDGMGFSETCSICTGTGSVVELILALDLPLHVVSARIIEDEFMHSGTGTGSARNGRMACPRIANPTAASARTPRRSSARRPLAAAST